MAIAARVLKGFNDSLASQSLKAAEALYLSEKGDKNGREISTKIMASIELLITTGNKKYSEYIVKSTNAELLKNSELVAQIGRVLEIINDKELSKITIDAAVAYKSEIDKLQGENPFGVPYRPHIWGDGWSIQSFGVRQYFLQKGFPAIYDKTYMLNALNFVLGNHPGENTSSFVSGVGSRSVTQAYGVNRADRSFIPGGSVSGTGIIRPDFPELKEWPYFWQQTEYVMGGGSTNFMFMVLAAEELLK